MNSVKAIVTGSMFGLGLLLAGGQSAQALQAVWDVPYTPSDWTRGTTPGSHYAEWNLFNDDGAAANIQDTSPEVGSFGGGTYEVAETTGAAFLTSGGNIYSPSAATAFNFTVGNLGGGSGDTHDVSLLISSVGAFDTTLNQSFTNFLLNGVAGAYTERFNEAITGGFGGNEVEALISWNDVPTASLFALTWNAVGSSVSLDQLSIDVSPGASSPVPLPAAAYLMISGLAGIVAMARRKQQAV